jgi:hypothetical protein
MIDQETKRMEKATKRSIENMVIYTDPGFTLSAENVFHSFGFYRDVKHFERVNEGMKVLILIPKADLPKSKRKKKTSRKEQA